MEHFWDKRYRDSGFAYGQEPNVFFQEQIALLPVGKILLPAEGEGRNAVYAAQKGWEVHAFDSSIVARDKALRWAADLGVSLDYRIADFEQVAYLEADFDCIAFVFTHFPKEKQQAYFQRLFHFLKPGGNVIVEVFSEDNLPLRTVHPQIGGPATPDMLFGLEDMEGIFHDFAHKIVQQVYTELHEGVFHNGTASVIRVVATKKIIE